jgi:predicted nucleic acid-binding protein
VNTNGDAATPDSSVVIAAFSSWNEYHDAAIEALADARDLVAHAELETYSVLTRLPEPLRMEPKLVAQYLREDYPGKRIVLPAAERRALITRFARLSIAGGAVYDGIVAATAAHHGYRLISCDRRAATVYDRLGIDVIYL